jgi:hypothetical protein
MPTQIPTTSTGKGCWLFCLSVCLTIVAIVAGVLLS